MKGCSPKPNAADLKRYEAFRELGCICCRIDDNPDTPAEIHHIIQSDNQQTLPLCEWHHRGQPPPEISTTTATSLYGPSLAISKPDFEAHYGTEAHLLEGVNKQVAAIQKRWQL